MITRILTISIIFFGFINKVNSQGANSPYSGNGVGEPVFQGNLRNIGMGGIGVSSGNGLYSNLLNPALLQNNNLTLFEAAFYGEYKENTTSNSTQRDDGGNISYFTFAFPVKKNWTTGFGLRPVTSVNYEVSESNLINGTNTRVIKLEKGTGGISQLYFSNGINVWKGLCLGLNINYNFGSITDEWSNNIEEISRLDIINLKRRSNYSQFTFASGISYSHKLKEATKLNFGATYEKSFKYKSKFFESTQRLSIHEIVIISDTLTLFSSRKVNLPATTRIGISIEKPYKYLVGINFEIQTWSVYEEFGSDKILKDTYKISFGGEWIPDPNSISNYLKRITFRAGVNYKQLPWIDQESQEQINEMNTNLGFSFPLAKGTSTLNFAFTYGKRGMDSKALINEKFYRLHLGLTVNNQWFVRRKIN